MKKVVKPRQLWGHLAEIFGQEFASFDRRKFWNELGVGTILSVFLWTSVRYGLSVKADWDEYPLLVIGPYVLPFAIVLIDAFWRFAKAVKRLYRERKHASFRDAANVAIVLVAGWVIVIGGIVWYLDYVTSPRFAIEIFAIPGLVPGKTQGGADVTGGLSIGDTDDARQPSTSVLFFQVHVTNSGALSAAHNWRLKAKISGAPEALEGEIYVKDIWMTDPKDTSQKHFIFSTTDFIFGRSGQPFKGTVSGPVYFIFPGVSAEALRTPGTKLILSCQDDTGKASKVVTVVPAQSTLLRSFSSTPPLVLPQAPPIEQQREVIVPAIDVLPYVPGQRVEANVHLSHINNSAASEYRDCFQMSVGRNLEEDKIWNLFVKTLRARSATCTDNVSIPYQHDEIITEGSLFSPHAMQDLTDGKRSLYLTGIVTGISGNPQTPYCAVKHMQTLTRCKYHN